MSARAWIVAGALWAALGVGLGAFGAHALNERLAAAGKLDVWDTAVSYHVWHALALVLVGLWRERVSGANTPGWCFLLGSLCFSGSLYGLALEGPRWLGPITPLGGALLIAGWLAFAWQALRAR